MAEAEAARRSSVRVTFDLLGRQVPVYIFQPYKHAGLRWLLNSCVLNCNTAQYSEHCVLGMACTSECRDAAGDHGGRGSP